MPRRDVRRGVGLGILQVGRGECQECGGTSDGGLAGDSSFGADIAPAVKDLDGDEGERLAIGSHDGAIGGEAQTGRFTCRLQRHALTTSLSTKRACLIGHGEDGLELGITIDLLRADQLVVEIEADLGLMGIDLYLNGLAFPG